jgi:hypothetical protein
MKPKKPNKKTKELPASKAALESVRSELKHDITSLSLKMDSKFSALEGKMDSKFAASDSSLAAISAKLDRVLTIVEHNSSEMKYLFDGHASLDRRVTSLEGKSS